MDGLSFIIPLILGYLLDLLLGDPRWLPHPIRWFGQSISVGERMLNKGNYRKAKGAFLSLTLIGGTFFVFYALMLGLSSYPLLHGITATIFVFYGLANKSLIEEGEAVIEALEQKGVEAGRKRLAWIVGRDVSQLSENKIRIAVLETLSENLSDGVVAPLFFYAIGGVPGIMAYKMTNTLDSMIAYKSAKYLDFGHFAAKIDDYANFIPARITAILIALVNWNFSSWKFIWKYGAAHASPNAGYPEAALAGVLDCQFGGPNYYKGKLVEKPYIGHHARLLQPNDMKITVRTNHLVTLVSLVMILCLYFWGIVC
ncbi:adenosylcobinamide-phosphate synthase CbiB [Aureispira anguillae]|uniref:Cobalamin biosynthesis protein CobD n=1 Tax=Aureispira anguillae TaxID=2864201 RepID=A0A916DQH9_9BACT|nr:adenosylcobinamide-phosphate synthase CbiB [Aureispira anguillae]BDS11184.1 adenosylcobinamide-phosphate synthase CbiB [Aureispira anguillae]